MTAKSSPYIDPQVAPMLEQMLLRRAERGPMGSSPLPVMRARFAEDIAAWNLELPDIEIKDLNLALDRGSMRARIYLPPERPTPSACLIFIHGGGWVVGDLDTNERSLRELALASHTVILSLDYPLAPETKFPGALDCCAQATRWLQKNAGDWGIDPQRIALGGDSAGGNLALATAIDLRDSGFQGLQFLLLVYPALNPNLDSESHREFGGGDYGLTTSDMAYFWTQYLPDGDDAGNDPRAAPLLADLHGLPATYIVTAGLDALTDDARELREKLEAASVAVAHKHYPGVLHGFFSMARLLDSGARAVADAAVATRQALNTGMSATMNADRIAERKADMKEER